LAELRGLDPLRVLDDRYRGYRQPELYHGAGVGAKFAAAIRDLNLIYNLARWQEGHHVYRADPEWMAERNKLYLEASGLGDYVAKYPRLASAKSLQEHQAVSRQARQEIQDRGILHGDSKQIKTSAAALFFLICVAAFLLSSHLNKRGGIAEVE
jgi:hypothetical protein